MAQHETAEDAPYKMQDLVKDLEARGIKKGSWASFRSVVAEAVDILDDVRFTRDRPILGNSVNWGLAVTSVSGAQEMDDSLELDPYLCYAINVFDAAKVAFDARVAQEHARIDADPAYQDRPDLREWLKS